MKKTLAILASAMLAIFMLTSCNNGPKALTDGQWDYNFLGEVTSSYQFNTDGTGRFISSMGDDFSFDFTYTIEGDSIAIDNGAEFLNIDKYAYSIDGEKLTLKGGFLDTETTYEWAKRK